jgi:hypothetical protein
MDNFPKILSPQVVLMRGNYLTGHVLDCNLELHLAGSEQEVYTVFNSLDDAVKYAETFKQKRQILIEFHIYDCNNNYVKSYFPEKESHMRLEAAQVNQAKKSWLKKCIESIMRRG